MHPFNKSLKKNVSYIWDKKCEHSFREIKKQMESDDFIVHYDPNLKIVLATDASPYGLVLYR